MSVSSISLRAALCAAVALAWQAAPALAQPSQDPQSNGAYDGPDAYRDGRDPPDAYGDGQEGRDRGYLDDGGRRQHRSYDDPRRGYDRGDDADGPQGDGPSDNVAASAAPPPPEPPAPPPPPAPPTPASAPASAPAASGLPGQIAATSWAEDDAVARAQADSFARFNGCVAAMRAATTETELASAQTCVREEQRTLDTLTKIRAAQAGAASATAGSDDGGRLVQAESRVGPAATRADLPPARAADPPSPTWGTVR